MAVEESVMDLRISLIIMIMVHSVLQEQEQSMEVNISFNINAIDLTPVTDCEDDKRFVYYSVLTGYNLYALCTNILKN